MQKDVNLEMYDWYFSGDFLRKVLKKVPQQLDRLKRLSRDRELTEAEVDLQLALCECTRSRMRRFNRSNCCGTFFRSFLQIGILLNPT